MPIGLTLARKISNLTHQQPINNKDAKFITFRNIFTK